MNNVPLTHNIRDSIGIAFISMGLYVFAFIMMYPITGPSTLALAFIPPAIAGWLLGARGGLLSGLLSFSVTTFLLYLVGDTASTNSLGAAALGGSSVMLTGLVIGWIRGLLDRLKKQTRELQEERALLQEEVKRRVVAEERLTHESLHDPLTNLPNRRLFVNRLEHAVAWSRRNSDVQRIQASLGLPYEWKGKLIDSGASIGVVINLTAYEQIDDIIRDADTAMYRAKGGGGNEFRVFGDGIARAKGRTVAHLDFGPIKGLQ